MTVKELKDFIKESQEINESLLGDIIRKLLDTGLSWIEGSVKWIANKSADVLKKISGFTLLVTSDDT